MNPQDNTIDKNQILTWYIDDVLNDKQPKNVYAFSQAHQLDEAEFYNYFSNLETIENYFYDALFEATLETLQSSEDYELYPAKDKILSFYYTFFENLKMNRSFVQHSIGSQSLKDLGKLKGLRKGFLEYANHLEIEKIDFKQKDINKASEKVMAESAWLHLLGTLKFWLNDKSANFEKTDVFIEKSVNAGFELINVSAFKNVADFGKFIFKEFNPVK
ncbi:TetR family transcriptional regulator C-terminal domain-containing protein [Weeksellaceae bacterium KMM 9724]|uniref:TetR family transcriptional regulator C-terminal domain-containing protein n=1 Tax=Profundicola chukchiensis TaxID=2961959 RepID=UPI00243E32F7|nr:TetR family transcriptional regulator C-terminal domain-containing protein [Profundicola chukchiensis]MDG4950564.1 TetR family transcriptional regulator C-terminal domain-containing protein [Profundicola chukchiensis]